MLLSSTLLRPIAQQQSWGVYHSTESCQERSLVLNPLAHAGRTVIVAGIDACK